MADIQAFRGLRYDLAVVGSLTSVVAPPYDVIDDQQQNDLYNRNDFNIIRLILNRGDDLLGDQTIYDRAAEHFKSWKSDGVLKTENVGVIYVYHQTFSFAGVTHTRRGFICRTRLEPFGTGRIFPHEETHSKAKEDRFKLMTACRANLSPIFGIFPDPENEAQTILEAAIDDQTPLTATDEDGATHQMWLVKDPAAIAHAAEILGVQSLYIADGHHRYETSCNLQQSIRESESIDVPEGEHPVDYTMMMCVSMHDPGMIVLPTHRLFRGLEAISSSQLIEKLGAAFECERVGNDSEQAGEVWEMIQIEDRQTTMGFYCRSDDQWVLARITKTGREMMKELAIAHSDTWCELGVAVLHKLVIEHLLGNTNPRPPKYVHAIEEVIDGLNNGDDAGRDATGQSGSGSPFELAALVMPATVEHVQAISENGERMPAKSTYFYPKLLSGLVVNPLET
jgi:uncharacterized protein (DUF1015 family)